MMCSQLYLFFWTGWVSAPPFRQNWAKSIFTLPSPEWCVDGISGTKLDTNSSVCAGEVGDFGCLCFQWGKKRSFSRMSEGKWYKRCSEHETELNRRVRESLKLERPPISSSLTISPSSPCLLIHVTQCDIYFEIAWKTRYIVNGLWNIMRVS